MSNTQESLLATLTSPSNADAAAAQAAPQSGDTAVARDCRFGEFGISSSAPAVVGDDDTELIDSVELPVPGVTSATARADSSHHDRSVTSSGGGAAAAVGTTIEDAQLLESDDEADDVRASLESLLASSLAASDDDERDKDDSAQMAATSSAPAGNGHTSAGALDSVVRQLQGLSDGDDEDDAADPPSRNVASSVGDFMSERAPAPPQTELPAVPSTVAPPPALSAGSGQPANAVPVAPHQQPQQPPGGAMPTGQVHRIFRAHWAQQAEDQRPFRMAIESALSSGQKARRARLVNMDNWLPPSVDVEVAGARSGVRMPDPAALPHPDDPMIRRIPECHPDDVLLPEKLMVKPATPDDTDDDLLKLVDSHHHQQRQQQQQPPPVTLRPHQIDGIRFMWDKLCDVPRDSATRAPLAASTGCILAHSMGLGKTCQVLSFLFLFARCSKPTMRVMLFVPKSTMVSWASEMDKWTPFYFDESRRGGPRKPQVHVFDDSLRRSQKLALLRRLQLGLDVEDEPAQENAAGIYMLSYEGAVNLTTRTSSDTGLAPTGGGGGGGGNTTEIVDASSLRVDVIVCDEAHRLKSDKRLDTRMIRAIESRRRLLLTGTPLQNHLQEYYVMINLTMPNFFPKKMFREFFARPIARSMSKHADPRTIEHARQRTFTLIREVDAFVQRRDGSVLAKELPKLIEFVVVVPLTSMQRRLYDQLLSILRDQGRHLNILQAFSYAAKLCAHPQVLFDTYRRVALAAYGARANAPLDEEEAAMVLSSGSDSDDDDKQGKPRQGRSATKRPRKTTKAAASTTRETSQSKFAQLCAPPRGYSAKSSDSAKMQIALEIIRHTVVELKEKVLVFSMSTALLDFVERVLDSAATTPGNEMLRQRLRVDGSSSSADRKEQIDAFQAAAAASHGEPAASQELRVNAQDQQRYPIFLLSTKAGGVGLTLTAATRVIILDCSWNPADDRQAIGRAYRYGQTRPVFVYRLVCQGTIEHRIFEQKLAKEWLFQTVVDSEVVKRDKLKGVKLQNFLFRPPTDSTVTPEAERDTERCCRADALLTAMRALFSSATTHNTMLEEDDETYGAAEQEFYEQYKKRGGLLSELGEPSVTASEDASAVAARNRRTEQALQAQSRTLFAHLQNLVNQRQQELIARGGSAAAQLRAMQAKEAGTPGSGERMGVDGVMRPNASLVSTALADLLDAHAARAAGRPLPATAALRARIGQPQPVVGPGSSRTDALAIDESDSDDGSDVVVAVDDDGAGQRRPPQPAPRPPNNSTAAGGNTAPTASAAPPPPVATAAAAGGYDDVVFIDDSDDD